jgi:phosphatidylinositol alpha-mannosyltransferase
MKIALISPYDFAYPGGVLNHITNLEQQLTRMGHDVKIIAPASKAVSALGERLIPIGSPRPIPVSGSVARITLSPWLSSRIKKVLEREKFEIVHLHEPLMPMLCTTVLRLSDVPNVGTFHASGGKPWYDFGTPLGKLILKKWFRKLDYKIAVSQIARNYVNKFFPDEYSIIPNGVDTEHFRPDVKPIEEYLDGKLNIMFIGRLEKRKGLDYLLKAYQQVKRSVPESRLIVVGPGIRLRKKYEKRVARDGIEDVVFIGYATYGDLPRYYKTADIICCPATGWESFGIVLIEAMAVGTAVVASNISGYASVLTHDAEGLLVPPKNIPQLAEALLSLANDKSRRQQMGQKGITTAQQYSWENVAKQVLACYHEVIG